MAKISQNKMLLGYLQEHGSIEPMEALNELSIYRLASRICDLREAGHDIRTERVTTVNRWGEPSTHARYVLQ